MTPRIVVLLGGCSAEREVSLRSGAAVASALERLGADVRRIELTQEALPDGLDPTRDIVFPVLHGTWGEDGGLQALLEARGFSYVGCDARASRLCMDKPATKLAASRVGVPVAKGAVIEPRTTRTAAEIVCMTGADIVLKPAAEGSSVGLTFISGQKELESWLLRPRTGRWMAEERLRGRELTCGVLDGRPMGVVEIAPRSGAYDYASKYTAGASEYLYPAPIGDAATAQVRAHAAAAFKACGCRDFARIDFILLPSGDAVLLEVNTLPGMTETSLLPKSASCIGLDFDALVARMLEPALARGGRLPIAV